MNPLFQSFAALVAVGLLVFAGGSPAPKPSFGSAVQLESIDFDKIAARSPLCDCANCQCSKCFCNTVDQEPLKVGSPPESLVVLTSGGELLTEQKFTEPKLTEPVKPVPVVAKKAAAGHWESRQSCGRGGCSMQQVWVPHNVQAAPVAQQCGSCGPGGCGVSGRRGWFGRRR